MRAMTQRSDDSRRRSPDRASGRGPAVYTAFALPPRPSPCPPACTSLATPIGNLKDVTFRALSTLAAADAVLAE